MAPWNMFDVARSLGRAGGLLALLAAVCRPVCGEVPPSQLVQALPATANAMMSIDFDAIEQNTWAQNHQLQARDVVAAPAGVQELMLGAHLDFEYLAPTWQVSFVTFENDYKLSDLTAGDVTQLETVADKPVVWFEDEAAAVALTGNTFGLAAPISRQFATEWIRRDLVSQPQQPQPQPATPLGEDGAVEAGPSSEFLQFAAQTIEDPNNILVLAVDFRDTFPPETARQIVEFSQLFPREDLERATELLAGMQGAVLTVRATDQLSGRLQVRFTSDATPLAPLGPALVDNILTNIGARIPEMANWTATAEGNVLTLVGPLTEEGLNRLGSLAVFDPATPRRLRRFASAVQTGARVAAADAQPAENPITDPSQRYAPDVPPPPPAQAAQAAAERAATLDHLQRLRRILGVLHRESNRATLFESRFWLDRAAIRLEYLNQENVDQDLVALTESIAYRLRDMADQLETAGLQAARQIANTGWISTPTWETINVGGIRYRQRALYYAGGDTPLIDRMQANVTLRDAHEGVREIGRSIVRDVNLTGSALAMEHGFSYQPWQPRGWEP